jgi:RNA polymerase sigma factor (sigma-70 family)
MADRSPERRGTARVVARLRDGDPDAVHELYERYGRAIFTVGYRALGDRSLAEEVVQLTFLKAWQAAATFDPERALAPWLYAIARRTAIDVFRREARHVSSDHEIDIAALPPTFEELWEVWEVRTAVDRLPVGERVVIESMHYRGLTLQETADELGIPVGTVKSRSHRAHGRLASLLGHVREVSA